jgi:uncharacterized membrane protein YbaN (DUF454 family)
MAHSSPPTTAVPYRAKPLNPVARWLLVCAGTILAGLGIVGVFVPGLPTTPFVLLAALCYMRSSERMLRWLTSHRRLGPHVKTFVETRAVSRKAKLTALVMGWTFLGATALFVAESLFLKTLLLSLGLVKTVAILLIKTAPTSP